MVLCLGKELNLHVNTPGNIYVNDIKKILPTILTTFARCERVRGALIDPKTAEQQGPRLLGNVGVQAAIATERAKRDHRTGVSADWVLREGEHQSRAGRRSRSRASPERERERSGPTYSSPVRISEPPRRRPIRRSLRIDSRDPEDALQAPPSHDPIPYP